MSKRQSGGLVYSTEQGRMCPQCRNAQAACTCSEPVAPAGDGVVRVSRETKGRKGKGVTIVTGLPLAGDELKNFARKLKARCGTGGTVKGNTIEIQGDQRDILIPVLQEQGWTVKRAGG